MRADHTQTYIHLSVALQCPCLLFWKWWMGKYLSLCVIRQPINSSKGGVFILSLTHTQIHICMILQTQFPYTSKTERGREGETCSHVYYLSLTLSLPAWLCLASFFSVRWKKRKKEEHKKNLPRIPCWASSSSIEIIRLYLVILSAPLRPPSLT